MKEDLEKKSVPVARLTRDRIYLAAKDVTICGRLWQWPQNACRNNDPVLLWLDCDAEGQTRRFSLSSWREVDASVRVKGGG